MLSFGDQLRLAAFEAPTAARTLRANSGAWLVAYIAAAAGVLALVAWQLARHSGDLLQLAMDYVLPASWHVAARMLLDELFAQQEQLVIMNAIVAASLVLVQITLFPLKEKVSAALEHDARLVAEPVEEHPLWFQAWEEIKIFLAMLAAQGCVFWLGYSDDPARRKLAVVASFLVLAASVAVDFLSPVLQRHKLRYSQILKSLLAHPVLSLGFGALFALPAVGAVALASSHPAWSFATRIGVAFGGQVVGVALAVLGGTVAGAPLVADARGRTRSRGAMRMLAWLLLLGVLAWNGYRFGAVGRSLHHKSQLLKCDYTIDWSSFEAETPSALELLDAARRDSITLGVSFDLTVANPTGIDVEIEDNHLDVRQRGVLIGQTKLPRGRVAAGSTQKLRLTLPLTVVPSQVLRIRELVTSKDWTITLYLDIDDGFTFPVYLLTRT